MCICTYVNTCKYKYKYMYKYIYIYKWYIYIYTNNIYIYTHNIYIYTNHVYIYICICEYMYIYIYMEVSWNGGTSKSSILIGFFIMNHPRLQVPHRGAGPLLLHQRHGHVPLHRSGHGQSHAVETHDVHLVPNNLYIFLNIMYVILYIYICSHIVNLIYTEREIKFICICKYKDKYTIIW